MAKINLKKTSRDFLDPFSTNVPLLYPLKTSVNQRFSGVFRSYRSGTLVENGLRYKLITEFKVQSFLL